LGNTGKHSVRTLSLLWAFVVKWWCGMKKDCKVTFTNWKVYSAHVEIVLLWELENLWFFKSW